jgi:hypothetical protein
MSILNVTTIMVCNDEKIKDIFDSNFFIRQINIPKEYSQIDFLFIELHDSDLTMDICENELQKIYENISDKFDSPFLRLHLARRIASSLLLLSIDKNQPLDYCLTQYQKVINLEYGSYEISRKINEAILVSRYAKQCGRDTIAKLIISKIKKEIENLRDQCDICLDEYSSEFAVIVQ